jgi:uncharacterized sulfatase
VLLVAVDDLTAEVGVSGGPLVKTPNLDRLAGMGRRFDRAYCQFPLCSPSRTSFLTGLRPETTRVLDNLTPPRSVLPEAVMLPQHFRQNGYHTAYVGKIFHGPFQDARSWDETLVARRRGAPAAENDEEEETIAASLPAADRDDTYEFDGAAARAAAAFLRRKHDKPFFLGVGFRRPHGFLQGVPKKYFDLYDPAGLSLPNAPADAPSDTPRIARRGSMRLAPPDEAARRRSLHAYYASVSFMDAQLGLLLDALEETGLGQTTVIVLWSDHGYHLGDRSGLWGKRTLYERAARVPLVIAGVGVRQPGRPSASLVELLDVYPTLVELSGLPPRPELEGRSLRPILEDPNATLHEAAFTMMPGGRSVRTWAWRYTEWGDGRAAELYDHRADPDERHNLVGAPEQARTVAELQLLLRRHSAEKRPVAPK